MGIKMQARVTALFVDADGIQRGFYLSMFNINSRVLAQLKEQGQVYMQNVPVVANKAKFEQMAKQFNIENAEWNDATNSVRITDCDDNKITRLYSDGRLKKLDKIHVVGKCGPNNYIVLMYKTEVIQPGIPVGIDRFNQLQTELRMMSEVEMVNRMNWGQPINVKLVNKGNSRYFAAIRGTIPEYGSDQLIHDLASTTRGKALKATIDSKMGNDEADSAKFIRSLEDARYLGKTLFGNSMGNFIKLNACKRYINIVEDGKKRPVDIKWLIAGYRTSFRRLIENIYVGKAGKRTRKHYKNVFELVKSNQVDIKNVKSVLDTHDLIGVSSAKTLDYISPRKVLDFLNAFKAFMLDCMTYNRLNLAHSQLKNLVVFLEGNPEARKYVQSNIEESSMEAIKTGIEKSLKSRVDSMSTALLMSSLEIIGLLEQADVKANVSSKIYDITLCAAVVLKEPSEIQSEDDYGYMIWQGVVIGAKREISKHLK